MNTYKNGNYTVFIMDDGTKIRHTNEDEFIPNFAENCDVKITSKCSICCPFCYEGCTKNGEHADLSIEHNPFLDSLHPYTELALNGNDIDHPQLEEFLEFLKSKKVYTNITVHQLQFTDNLDKLKEWADKKLIHGLGISLTHPDDLFINRVKEFPNAVIHTINGILEKEDIDLLANHNLKILILGYKSLNRGIEFKENRNAFIEGNQNMLKKELPNMLQNDMFSVVSFDNLALEQLNVKDIVPEKEWNDCYMGDDGQYTFYIDIVKGEFSKNSIATERYNIGNKTIDEMFQFIKEK